MARPLARRNRGGVVEFWPGFVDALSTLLIVIIFLILVFILAQYFLGQALSGKDAALAKLNAEVARLADMLALDKTSLATLEASNGAIAAQLSATIRERDAALARGEEADQLQARIAAADAARADSAAQARNAAQAVQARDAELAGARQRIATLEGDLAAGEARRATTRRQAAERDIQLGALQVEGDAAAGKLAASEALSAETLHKVDLLNQQLAQLRQQLADLEQALGLAKTSNIDQATQIADLTAKLNTALASRIEELARYRSEFFGRLRAVLGDRPGVRIVGDRFVFQSEVLFDPGAAALGERGRTQIAELATTLKELAAKIPPDIGWLLQVDGHTDAVPIHTAQFASNWELSSARAIAVVKFLIDKGVPADRLSAAGFGEFDPIDRATDDGARKRNRRIELKLTQR